MNFGGKGYWGAKYMLCDREGDIVGTTYHITPLYEFLDGRFEQIVIEKQVKYEVEVYPQWFIFDTEDEAREFVEIFKTSKGNIDYDITETKDY